MGTGREREAALFAAGVFPTPAARAIPLTFCARDYRHMADLFGAGRVGVMTESRWWGAWIAALAAAIVCAEPACAQLRDTSVRLGVGPSGTRVVIDSPAKITATPANSEDQRMVFDVSGIDVAQPLAGVGAGLGTNWRLDRTETGPQLT